MPTIEDYREEMIATQLERRGITDARVLEAFRRVPRHAFIPEVSIAEAYADHPVPIGHGQTISQPYMVALMTQLLRVQPHHRVLEIGAGSGYQTAILARLCQRVLAVERIAELSERGKRTLEELGVTNVEWLTSDGTFGHPAKAPYDGILVAAGAPSIPRPLLEQLAEGGHLVIPVGRREYQELQVVVRHGEDFESHTDTLCRFVNLVGAHGW